MTFHLTALYRHPADPAAFDAHYDGVHTPLTLKLPGLESFTVSRPGPGPDGKAPDYYLVAVLGFADQETANASVGGPEGEAALADLPNFAGAGVTILSGPANVVR
ncbi:EthD family reductase [Amycolatopsis sp. Poz14]|uniref:EthD family reductase n=1 Tax=Amycolatopsis sp. Poz14 TaxID=1447705 RepID=UPI001EE98C93|nr:EthD family reductase [Amycolatopsis sp. Poz14]MCG3753991.1 EthD family reductase [Amycolatopsis sp. Poz14]